MKIPAFLFLLTLFFSSLAKMKRIPLTKHRAAYQKFHKKANETSNTPAKTHFMARIQVLDFELMQYSGYVKIGSDLTNFQVIFDTGSSYLWVASSECTSCISSGLTQFFDCSSSSSCDNLDSQMTVSYGTGSLKGTFVEDNVQIGDYTAEDQNLLTVTEVSDFESFESNGILGLGSTTLAGGVATLIDNLKSQGEISNRIFSFYLGGRNDSYLPQFTLDGYDDRLIQNGSNITYCSVVDRYYWAVSLGEIIVKGSKSNKTAYKPSKLMPYTAIIDSGTSLFVVDTSTYNNLLTYLNLYVSCSKWQDYILCLSNNLTLYPDIVVNLCGTEFVLSPEDYLMTYYEYYLVLFEASSDSDYFILGDTFMRKFYTVFDQENNTIGFAVAARGGEEIEWDWSFGGRKYFWMGMQMMLVIGLFLLN